MKRYLGNDGGAYLLSAAGGDICNECLSRCGSADKAPFAHIFAGTKSLFSIFDGFTAKSGVLRNICTVHFGVSSDVGSIGKIQFCGKDWHCAEVPS